MMGNQKLHFYQTLFIVKSNDGISDQRKNTKLKRICLI